MSPGAPSGSGAPSGASDEAGPFDIEPPEQPAELETGPEPEEPPPPRSPAVLEHTSAPPRHAHPPHGESRDVSREPHAKPKKSGISAAIEQVNDILEELKHALDQMNDVLETLELAEREKFQDEHEIENLQRALRRLNRPREDVRRQH